MIDHQNICGVLITRISSYFVASPWRVFGVARSKEHQRVSFFFLWKIALSSSSISTHTLPVQHPHRSHVDTSFDFAPTSHVWGRGCHGALTVLRGGDVGLEEHPERLMEVEV